MAEAASVSDVAITAPSTTRKALPGTKSETASDSNETRLEPLVVGHDNEAPPARKKPPAFILAFIGIAITVFLFHLDATALGVALPVSHLIAWVSSKK